MLKPTFIALLISFLVVLKPAAADSVLRLATTTSTENSGLLSVLLPEFEKNSGLEVHTIAVGTGKALRLGEQGDVDIVMVHAKPAEEQFVQKGYGVAREELTAEELAHRDPLYEVLLAARAVKGEA